jgi:tight adherence protein C
MESLVDIFEPANLLSLLVAVLVFATVVTLAAPMFQSDKLVERMNSVANRREELRKQARAQMRNEPTASIRQTDESFYKRVVERLQLSKLLEDPKVVDTLAQAGYRGPKPISTFYFFRFATPFVFACFSFFYLFILRAIDWPTTTKMCAVVVAFVAGFYAPNIYLSNVIQKRREAIVGAFPDALDLLLICVEAGMSIELAIQKVAGEIGSRSIELAEELTLLGAELSYLPERRMAYDALAKRVNYPGIKAVTTAMTQAERYGTPLGSALRVMAKENRELRIAEAEKIAAQLPAKLTVPMVIFFLPVLFLVILGPAYIKATDSGTQHDTQQRMDHK